MTETQMTTTGPESNPLVFVKDGEVFANSLDVADRFEKRHADVLRAVEQLDCSEEFRQRNFAFSTYRPEGARRDYPYAALTRDGFTFLVMGFTGQDAALWKERYIQAFNQMEAELRSRTAAINFDPTDPAQLLPLLSSYAERTQIAEARVIEFQPKAQAFDRLDTADGNLTLRPASKVLGYPERKLARWLEMNRWAFRQGGGPLQAYVAKRNCGYLDHKLHNYHDEKTGEDKVSITMVITPKGLARLAQLLPMDGAAA